MAADTCRIPQRIREAVKARDLAGGCRRHHRVKTHSPWTLTHDPTSPRVHRYWASPLGQIYTTAAHDYRKPEG